MRLLRRDGVVRLQAILFQKVGINSSLNINQWVAYRLVLTFLLFKLIKRSSNNTWPSSMFRLSLYRQNCKSHR